MWAAASGPLQAGSLHEADSLDTDNPVYKIVKNGVKNVYRHHG